MKKNVVFALIIATCVLFLASTGSVLADTYTVTGDLKTVGTYTSSATGTLWSVLTGVGGVAKSNTDYILVTGAGGSLATFSAGEINTGLYATGANTVNVSADSNGDGGYTVSGNGQTVTDVSNINVVRPAAPVGTFPGGASAAFTVSGPGIATTTWTPSNLPQTDANVTISGMQNGKTPYTWTYTGVSIVSLLQSAGVNTSNLNQLVIAVGNDGYQITMSMSQIVAAGNLDLVADMSNDTTSLYYNLDGTLATDTAGFARTILGNQTANGQWDQMLAQLDVVPTPAPAALFLFAPGLACLAAIRRRIKK